MSDLRELYQALILDHGRYPRNFGVLPHANRSKEGFNPLCGDRLVLYLDLQMNVITNVSFQGCGCAISMASTSLMTEALKGKSVSEARSMFAQFHRMVTTQEEIDCDYLGKLAALKGVAEFPARVKCATLAWHTLIGALENRKEHISTE